MRVVNGHGFLGRLGGDWAVCKRSGGGAAACLRHVSEPSLGIRSLCLSCVRAYNRFIARRR
jgi:hypothetical protein